VRPGKFILMAMLALAVSACATGRQRTFEINRAGAEKAIATALKQPTTSAIEIRLRPEPATPPEAVWRNWNPGAQPISVLGVLGLSAGPDGLTPTMFAPDADGLARAAAFRAEDPNRRRIHVRVPYVQPATPESHAWRVVNGKPTVVLDTMLCIPQLDSDCLDYSDIRAIYLTDWGDPPSTRSYPVTRAGIEAAMRDLAGMKVYYALTFEVRDVVYRSSRNAMLYSLSVLEDTRICGSGYTPPVAGERCYNFADITSMQVWDRNQTAGDTLGDIASFPFRLVGALGSSMAIGAH
jgi:hypothetical protein